MHCLYLQIATWTLHALQEQWLPDTQVIGITPFLLAGDFWEELGWPWVHNISIAGNSFFVPREVFNKTQRLRCDTVGGNDCTK